MIGSKDERIKRDNNILLTKRKIIEFCLAESSNFLSVQKYQLVVPAATQALKFCRELDGDTSILLVEPYLQLAQASFGLRRFKQCEEYLALGQWIVLNVEECADTTNSRLNQQLGRLCVVKGEFEKAKEYFSRSIYYSSRCYGAESISTSIGYFRLGDVFMALGKTECCLAFFDKVVDIWYKYLSSLMSRFDNGSVDISPENNNVAVLEQLSEETMSEGRGQLQSVFEKRRQVLGVNHIATGEAQFTIGIFEFILLGNQSVAEELISTAFKIYIAQLGNEHPSTKHVSTILSLFSQDVKSDLQQNSSQFVQSEEFFSPE